MADFEQEVTSANKTIRPYSNWVSFSFRAAGIRLTQSGGRLIVVNYFTRRVFTGQMWMLSLMFPVVIPLITLHPFRFWTVLLHHATWRTILAAVLAIDPQLAVIELCMLFIVFICYCMFVTGTNFNGVVLNRRNGTAKARGTTRLLTDAEAVVVGATRNLREPESHSRRYMVKLLWSNEQKLLGWQRLLPYKGSKESHLGTFPSEADANNFANAVAEFAKIPVRHEIWMK